MDGAIDGTTRCITCGGWTQYGVPHYCPGYGTSGQTFPPVDSTDALTAALNRLAAAVEKLAGAPSEEDAP